MSEHDIFLAALEIADPTQRADYLARACAGNPTLQRQVEELLAVHARSGEFLDVPALQQVAADLSSSDPCGDPDATMSAEYQDSRGNIDLSFLQPSTVPGSLGRLRHYEIQEVIGQGGYGIVLKAFDEMLQRVVAIKVMAPELATTSPARKRFLREARAAAAVRHENVVSIFAVEDQPIPYLVMEYIAGQTLQQKLDASGPLDATEVVRIGQQISRGLEAAHALGLIHRDIKPGNILLEGEPGASATGKRVKITDFGLARAADDASITQSGIVAGTPLFMSPEQAQGQPLDHRSDLFSLGSVLYQMACGRPPFRAATTMAILKRVAEDQPRPIREIIPEVPDWLCAIIAKLHAKKPEDRFQSAKEVTELLARCQTQLQQHGRVELTPEVLAYLPKSETATKNESSLAPASPAAPVEPARRPLPQRSYRWVAAAAVIVVLLAGLGVTEATGVTNVRSTIIRLFSPDGTLIVEVDDPGVSVTIDGEDMVITGAGAREIRLKPGQYKLLASKDGKVVRQELVMVTTNGRQVVRVSKEAVEPKVTPDPERAAALALSKLGCTFHVRLKDGQPRYHQPLPAEPCAVFGVTFSWNKPLSSSVVESEVVPALMALPYLESMDTWTISIPFTPKDLSRLADSPVGRNLTYFHCRIDPSPEVLAVLARFPRLQSCSFSGTMHDDDLVAFAKSLPRGIDHLILGLRGNSRVGERGVAALTGLPLRLLEYTGPGFDRNFAKAIAGMRGLKGFAEHRWGTDIKMQLDDETAAELAASQSLEGLRLAGNEFTDAALDSFRKMPALRHLVISHNLGKGGVKVTEAGVKQLAAARPDLRIDWDGGTIEPKSIP